MKPLRVTVFLILLFGLAACRWAPGATGTIIEATAPTPLPATPAERDAEPAPQATAPSPTAAPVEPTDAPQETAADLAAAVEAAPDIEQAAAPDEASTSPFPGLTWDDRTEYATGLIDAQQGVLAELDGAPVYHMIIEIDDSLTTVRGRLAVHYTNQEGIDFGEIYFHLHPNLLDGAIEVADVTVNGAHVTPELEAGDTVMRVPLPQPLAPGEAAVIDMVFETTVPTDIGRNYGILAYADDVLALAHFYPMLAVYDEEGWNITPADVQGDVTYSDTGFYRVQVSAPQDLVLVGGGLAVEESSDGGRQTVTYVAGPMRDFYLAASPFYEAVSRTVGETTINSYAPPQFREGAEMALDTAASALASLGERLAPYPYTEFDIVTTPTAALGVEYPGIIANTIRMYDPDAGSSSGVPNSVLLESTTAHEAGHQWFYSLVGNDQLDEPWLDEALTQYATYLYYLDRYGPSGGEGYMAAMEGRWDRLDRAQIPIGLPVDAYEGPEYGAIVYGRGPVFVRALADEMGQEAFDALLRGYVAQNQWGVGTTAEFRALAEAACGCDLSAIFAEWVYE